MKILFICTSNKDRSPALEQYFTDNYRDHEFKSAGVNKYFTNKKGTHYLTREDIEWAEIIVYAEDIHYTVADRDFKQTKIGYKDCIILNLGEYKQGQIGEDYLLKAEEKIKKHL